MQPPPPSYSANPGAEQQPRRGTFFQFALRSCRDGPQPRLASPGPFWKGSLAGRGGGCTSLLESPLA